MIMVQLSENPLGNWKMDASTRGIDST